MSSDSPPAHPPPRSVEGLEALSETANKLERLKELTRKYSVSEVSRKEEETEQPLESHEVIELQAFVRHKEWIDDKIKFLESLPPIDIFVGVDELPKTHDQITTLPTRAQLDEWVVEHDKIEKESELLDAGDFKKLKALTKAATQRNLSPEDTDLIEITLTTLFGFDKLLHLLRDRSEQLDLFDTRLTWEEQRTLAYSTRDDLISRIHSFLDTRARWRADIYNNGLPTSSSSASLQSTSAVVQPYDPFSRATRFKRSETLSREIVQLSGRVSALRHGPVLGSGKALDRLIEDGRKPVPDAMLDEQDRVEEKCEKELSSVGKFLMTINLQWQKADEIYVETRKDVAGLQALSEEIKRASAEKPSRKAETMFKNKIQILKGRLQTRMNHPLSSTLPLPKHPLFPDQEPFNAELTNVLSAELSDARSTLSDVENAIRSYSAGCEAFDEVEGLRKEMVDLQQEAHVITQRLRIGFEAEGGNGLPPDLNQNSCVEPMSFSAFLASVPALINQSSQLEESALKATKRARLASLRLDKPGITADYRESFHSDIDELEKHVQGMVDSRSDVSRTISLLKDVRQVWSVMDGISKTADAVMPEIREALLMNQWKQQIGGESAPPTPESPRTELPIGNITAESINEKLVSYKDRLNQDVRTSLDNIRGSIPPSLHDFLCAKQLTIERSLFDLQSLHRLLVDVRGQKYAMETIREEVHSLEGRIEDSKVQYDAHFDTMLKSSDLDSEASSSTAARPEDETDAKEKELSQNVDRVESDVTSLVDSLPTRVPLISRRPSTSSGGASSTASRAALVNRLAFDPSAVDRSVRNDTNAYSMRLTSGVRSLKQKRSFGPFYRAARDMSKRVVLAQHELRSLADQLEQNSKELEELSDGNVENIEDGLAAIAALKDSLEDLEKADAERLRSLSVAIRGDISRMEAISGIQDDSVASNVLRARLRAFDDLHSQSTRILDRLKGLKADVAKAEQAELERLVEIARREKEAEEAMEAERREQERQRKEQEEAERHAKERMEQETSFRIQEESTPRRDMRRKPFAIQDDVFGPGTPSRQSIDKETSELLNLVRALRKQLKSIGLNSVVRPSGASRHRSSSASLPHPETAETMASDFAQLEAEANKLPASAENMIADTELRSLRLEMEASRELLNRVQQLARLQASITLCDTAFSTFLDYIDSYPNEPLPSDDAGVDHKVPVVLESPQERLSERMSEAKGIFGDMNEHFAPVSDDPRAITEHTRLKQTWEELSEMALEKISGRASRAPSALSTYNSSGRNSSASSRSMNTSEVKRSRYNNLSIGGRGGFLAPAMPSQRRATSASSAGSGSTKQGKQPSARPSVSIPKGAATNTRSVSGPMKQITPTSITRAASSLFNSTFASRQRTSSITSNTSAASTSRPPPSRRRMSSTLSDASRAASPTPSVASSRGTWSKAPRQSFSSLQRASTPERPARKSRQKYVANPKNKLDVALGDVINNLPVEINVEAVKDTWKDKSGKYWIGGNEPKLCFCRILRSQTVMVRVGGGWTELSKFIKDHFADLFCLLPETPPRPGSASKEQRWISAATLRNTDDEASLTKSSGSPDSSGRNVPSFAISTPDGTQKTGSPGSSPLTPFQFIRRADANASEISLSTLALSNDMSTSAVSTASIHPRRRMSSASSKFAWKP